MAALIERDRRPTRGREPLGGFRERVPRLPAAMEKERRARALAVDVADQPVAGGAEENFRLSA